MAPGTFATTLTYSPIVTRPSRDLWMLVSEPVDGAATRRAYAPGRRSRRVAYTWTGDGELQLTAVISSMESPVIHVPKEVSHLLEGKRFDVVESTTHLRDGVAIKAGTVWGFAPFLSDRGSHAGDVVQLRFELTSRTVALDLVRPADDGAAEVPLS
jgi:hypothetical protein